MRPDARIVGVDNDPIVLAHARAHGEEPAPSGATIVAGDVRRPAEILENPEVRGRLDFDRPVAVLLVAVMHFVIDEDDPYGAVRTLMDAVAPGSALVLSQVTADRDPAGVRATAKAYARSSVKTAVRSGKEIAAFFDRLEPVDPGLVMLSQWRPDEQVLAGDDGIGMYGGVAHMTRWREPLGAGGRRAYILCTSTEKPLARRLLRCSACAPSHCSMGTGSVR